MARKRRTDPRVAEHYFAMASDFLRTMSLRPDLSIASSVVLPRISPSLFGYTLSSRTFIAATAPVFRVIDMVTSMIFNHNKCYSYGKGKCDTLRDWVVENCLDFLVLKSSRVVKYIGCMIGIDGYLHRWTAPRNKIKACIKNDDSPKSLVSWSNTRYTRCLF